MRGGSGSLYALSLGGRGYPSPTGYCSSLDGLGSLGKIGKIGTFSDKWRGGGGSPRKRTRPPTPGCIYTYIATETSECIFRPDGVE